MSSSGRAPPRAGAGAQLWAAGGLPLWREFSSAVKESLDFERCGTGKPVQGFKW